jgi:hypothetical protein
MSTSLEIFRTYEVDGIKRRILYICGKELQYDDGTVGSIPVTTTRYGFICWLLTHSIKL